MSWWLWLIVGLCITGVPLLCLVGYLIHLMIHFMDGF